MNEDLLRAARARANELVEVPALDIIRKRGRTMNRNRIALAAAAIVAVAGVGAAVVLNHDKTETEPLPASNLEIAQGFAQASFVDHDQGAALAVMSEDFTWLDLDVVRDRDSWLSALEWRSSSWVKATGPSCQEHSDETTTCRWLYTAFGSAEVGLPPYVGSARIQVRDGEVVEADPDHDPDEVEFSIGPLEAWAAATNPTAHRVLWYNRTPLEQDAVDQAIQAYVAAANTDPASVHAPKVVRQLEEICAGDDLDFREVAFGDDTTRAVYLGRAIPLLKLGAREMRDSGNSELLDDAAEYAGLGGCVAALR